MKWAHAQLHLAMGPYTGIGFARKGPHEMPTVMGISSFEMHRACALWRKKNTLSKDLSDYTRKTGKGLNVNGIG
jgi:hypothetical protein